MRDEGPIIALGIVTLCVFSYFVGLRCGASLKAQK